MDFKTFLQNARAFDDARASLPGEHWAVLAFGVGLLLYAGGRRRSVLTRSVMRAVATGLLARAASGRDGLRSVAR